MARRRPRLDPKLAVALLRVSTTRERQALGLEAQRTAIETWARKHGVRIVAEHVDEASGAAPIDQRPALIAALTDLGTQRAGTLVVARLDRLAREPKVQALAEHELDRVGARLAVALDEGAGGDSDTAQLLRGILGHVAKFERSLIRQRIKAAVHEKMKQGLAHGPPAFGYRIGPDGRHIETDPREQAAIADARRLRDEEVSYPQIAIELERLGHVSRKGTPISMATVWHFLNREEPTLARAPEAEKPTRRRTKKGGR